MNSCPFCNIEKPFLTAKTSFSLVDIHPASLGHTLIIPKRHISSILQCTEEELKDLYSLMRETVEYLKKEDPTITGFNYGINEGESAGQTIDHLHLHVIPRRDNDTPNPRGGIRGAIPEKMSY
jgi:ATP adenylyltransferase